jgi:hypothetical protein
MCHQFWGCAKHQILGIVASALTAGLMAAVRSADMLVLATRQRSDAMATVHGKLAATAAFGFAAILLGTAGLARADQIWFQGKDRQEEHHVAKIGYGHVEHTIINHANGNVTTFHYKDQFHWITTRPIDGTAHMFVGGVNMATGQPLTTAPPAGALPPGGVPQKSDIRLKRDIVEVGHLDNGIGLYRFRYNWSDQVYVGVMAQEVAMVAPEAVSTGRDGYLRVDYRRLGLSMQTWDQWAAQNRLPAVPH